MDRLRFFATAVFVTVVVNVGGNAPGDEPKEKKPEPPSALLAVPFVIERGETTRCVVRGRSLDAVDKAESVAGVTVNIVTKGEAKVPDGWKPEQLGDRQVTCDIDVDASFPADAHSISLKLTTSSGESAGIDIDIAKPGALIDETEPNPGFQKSQPVEVGQSVRGVIGANKDVDVFQFEAEAGTIITAGVIARRRGSALDPMLTLFDARGSERARNDDAPESGRDASLTHTIPSTGRYFLVLQDAHDTGSDLHVYQMLVTATKTIETTKSDAGSSNR